MLRFPKGTSLKEAHEKSVELASEITKGMRCGLIGFDHLGGAPAWRKTVFDWISAARRGEGGISVSTSTTTQLATMDDKAAMKFLKLRDFTTAADVLKIEPEKVYWPFLCTKTKKAYSGSKYENLVWKKDEIKGQAAVRRDIPRFVSKCGKDVFKALFKKRADGAFRENIPEAKKVVELVIGALLRGELSLEDCVKSASIGTEYAAEPLQIVLVNKMRARGDDDVPGAGQRIDFVILEPSPSQLQSMTRAERTKVSTRIEHPDFVRAWNAKPEHTDKKSQLRLDREYYLEKLEPSVFKIFEFVDSAWCKRVFADAKDRASDTHGFKQSRLCLTDSGTASRASGSGSGEDMRTLTSTSALAQVFKSSQPVSLVSASRSTGLVRNLPTPTPKPKAKPSGQGQTSIMSSLFSKRKD